MFTKESLLSEYLKVIQDNRDELVRVLCSGTLIPFIKVGIITEEQKSEWSSLSSEERYDKILSLVIERKDINLCIKFSRCVQYINNTKTKKVFEFIPDIYEVGLHDPLMQGTIQSHLLCSVKEGLASETML